MTKKLLCILMTLALVMGLTAAFALESSAAGVVNIYESATDPVVDGAIDAGVYRFVCATGDDPAGNIVTWPDCRVDDSMELWACWKGDFLYLAVKVACTDHVAYMDNATEHFIFNAHYMMTCICPDDPYKDEYTGDYDDGSWSWSALYNAGHVYEWTIINPSQETTSDIDNHFLDMSSKEGFEFKVTTANGFDIYEQKIPLSQLSTKAAPAGIKGQVGSLFGFGFSIGLNDHGFGYPGDPEKYPNYIEHDDMVYYSDYFTGDKNIHGLAYCKLVSDIEKDPSQEESEAPAPTPIDTPYDVFPQLDGLWTMTEDKGQNVSITYSQGTTVVTGSTEGNWPSAKANFPNKVYIGEGTYLVYDFTVDTGATSILFNGIQMQGLIDENLDAGSGDLYAGEYKGAISYDKLAEKLGTDENGYVILNDMQVYSVNGATVTFKTFKLDPTYVPVDTPDVSDPEESVPEESTPVTDESEEVEDTSVPATDASDVSEDKADDKGGNTGLIIGIVIGVIAIIAVVVVIVLLKKKK